MTRRWMGWCGGVMALLLTGCAALEAVDAGGGEAASDPPSSPRVSEPLENRYWKLMTLDGRPVTVQDNRPEAHLVLHATGARVAGATGCNRLTGDYRLDGERLRFAALAVTRRACPEAPAAAEARLLAALRATATWRVRGDRLTLYDARGTRLARFAVRHLY